MNRYGLIGYPLSHSFSQAYFTEKFIREGIADTVYQNFPLPSLEAFPGLWQDYPDLKGLNVTIPYKKSVIPFLAEISPEVAAIGACNCIQKTSGGLKGYNTDIIGFRESFIPGLLPAHRRALILGTGGASLAVAYVLSQLGIEYRMVSRNPSKQTLTYDELSPAVIREFTVIVNTTPLGTFPDIHQCPDLPYEALTPDHYLFDLVYNPEETLFLKKGREQGSLCRNGKDMLTGQAEAAWEIWTRKPDSV